MNNFPKFSTLAPECITDIRETDMKHRVIILALIFTASQAAPVHADNLWLGSNAGWRFNHTSGCTADWNIGLGPSAGHDLCSGAESNIALGRGALSVHDGGVGNICIGVTSCRYMEPGSGNSYNTMVGTDALYNGRDVRYNVGMGYDALHDGANAWKNVAIGHMAGYDKYGNNDHPNNSNNVFVGYESGVAVSTIVENSIAIGFQAKATASHQVMIGNASTQETVLRGVVHVDELCIGATCIDEGQLQALLDLLN